MAVVAVVAAALLVVGCTSGGKPEPTDQAARSTSSTVAPARPLRVKLVASAKVPRGGLDAKRAARQAAPGLERFLDRYLTMAFVDAAGGKAGWDGLLGLFDKPVRTSARRQLDALSLGGAAANVSAVRPGRASARAVILYGARRPAAATVRLAFDGTADSAQGSGQVHLRSVLQLLSTGEGWRIAAFDSRTGPPK
ncbi:MAG TPA: hypothetical protein VGS14_09010 [Actinomycetes bacterium]|jgi:hypothetical protein|nr:hypothetical protein [Actinomycetes bacterium]